MSVSLVNKSASADKSGASMSYTVTSTTAGNLLVVLMLFRGNATDTVSSITDGGDTFVTSNARSSTSAAATPRGMEIWHCLDISGGITSITVNQTGTGIVSITAFEYNSTLGQFEFDLGGGTTNAISGTVHNLGASLDTTGTSDVLAAYWGSATSVYVSVASPFGYQQNDGHSNALLDAQNQGAATYQVDVTVDRTSEYYLLSTAAYKEPQASSYEGTLSGQFLVS